MSVSYALSHRLRGLMVDYGAKWPDKAREKAKARYAVKSRGMWQSAESMEKERTYALDRAFYVDSFDLAPCRHVAMAHKIARLDHTGWYTDDDNCGGVMRGHVLQLVGKDGAPRYIAGTDHSEWDGVTIYPLRTYDDKEEAARAADYYARIVAEKEREYQAEETRKSRAEEAREEIAEARNSRRAIIRDLKKLRQSMPADCGLPALRDSIKAQLAALRRASQKAHKRLVELEG